MKILKLFSFVLWFFLTGPTVAADQYKNFRVAPSVTTSIYRVDSSVKVKISEVGKKERYQVLTFDTESTLHLAVADYAFNGTKGFSVWYLDEGMGKDTISMVFLFSLKQHRFVEIRPACGDDFVNLQIDNVRRELVSTYHERNEAVLCRTKSKKLSPQ
ncbi:hypothetical protein [Caballeronia sp. HLA56]